MKAKPILTDGQKARIDEKTNAYLESIKPAFQIRNGADKVTKDRIAYPQFLARMISSLSSDNLRSSLRRENITAQINGLTDARIRNDRYQLTTNINNAALPIDNNYNALAGDNSVIRSIAREVIDAKDDGMVDQFVTGSKHVFENTQANKDSIFAAISNTADRFFQNIDDINVTDIYHNKAAIVDAIGAQLFATPMTLDNNANMTLENARRLANDIYDQTFALLKQTYTEATEQIAASINYSKIRFEVENAEKWESKILAGKPIPAITDALAAPTDVPTDADRVIIHQRPTAFGERTHAEADYRTQQLAILNALKANPDARKGKVSEEHLDEIESAATRDNSLFRSEVSQLLSIPLVSKSPRATAVGTAGAIAITTVATAGLSTPVIVGVTLGSVGVTLATALLDDYFKQNPQARRQADINTNNEIVAEVEKIRGKKSAASAEKGVAGLSKEAKGETAVSSYRDIIKAKSLVERAVRTPAGHDLPV